MKHAKTYKHWRIERDEQGIAWVYIDKADSNANSLSIDVLNELNSVIDALMTKPQPIGAVFLSGKPNGFIAGADINEFTKVKNYDEALSFIKLGQGAVDRIESLPFTTVAMIYGFCLGGGLELALGCTFRVAEDGPKTKLGLPEVQLGIHPGFGGSMRLTQLIGAPAAMDLMLTGRTINAKSAKKMGVVDYCVPLRHLKNVAQNLIMERTSRKPAKGSVQMTNSAFVRPFLARIIRKKTAQKAKIAHYPAPFALIDVWKQYGGNPRTMLEEEGKSVARLVTDATARNLVRVFFLRDRLKELGKSPANEPKIRNVHVIGAGVMGGDIAAWCALQGLQVTLQDRKPEILAKVLQRAYKLFDKRLKDRLLVQAAMDRLIPDIGGYGVERADIIVEAIIENVEAKQGLYRSLEPRMKPGALLTTNTSSIPLEILSQALKKPERLVGLHFFNPVAQMPLIEIVTTPHTDAACAQRVAAFAKQIDRLPLPVKSGPGFLVNRILMPYLLEAVTLYTEGISQQVIDSTALDFGMPMGPLHLADTVGLDICLSVAEILSKQLNVKVPDVLREKVARGELGIKTGHGFYMYAKDGKFSGSGNTGGKISKEVTDRLIGRMINEAVACLREGVVSDAELLDAGVIFGTGFAPFRGGPMQYVRDSGTKRYASRLEELQTQFGDSFKPDAGWSSLAGQN
ncbi:MAG: 3-hydroxyacyl-CoA dehydrogenase NAD-binding domain-containing protein [Gammaproteobacteria bacterium]|nr:3-hydroxyacyl-CoA dehydrogenase NAD-binding domain-containing protein [Gammaproteobacteria bacterium]